MVPRHFSLRVKRATAEVVSMLLAKEGVDVNQAMVNDGATPLFIASQNGHCEVVSMLLAKEDVDVNQATNDGIHATFSLRVKMATVRWCRCCWPRRASM